MPCVLLRSFSCVLYICIIFSLWHAHFGHWWFHFTRRTLFFLFHCWECFYSQGEIFVVGHVQFLSRYFLMWSVFYRWPERYNLLEGLSRVQDSVYYLGVILARAAFSGSVISILRSPCDELVVLGVIELLLVLVTDAAHWPSNLPQSFPARLCVSYFPRRQRHWVHPNTEEPVLTERFAKWSPFKTSEFHCLRLINVKQRIVYTCV